MPDPILLQYGNQYNVPVPVWYVESDDDLANIPDTEPAGTVAEVNETGNFHFSVKQVAGTWNNI